MTSFREKLSKYNLWKPAFFIMLFLFEIAREIAVVEGTTPPSVYTNGDVFINKDYVSANGEWVRVNNGNTLVRTPTTIECRENLGLCIESNYDVMHNWSLKSPDISIYAANFTNDAITWRNEVPLCVTYDVRIDKNTKKITSVIHKKIISKEMQTHPYFSRNKNACKNFENLIITELKESSRDDYDPTDRHFLPILKLSKYIINKVN